MRCMVDTNILNHLIDGKISIDMIPCGSLYATGAQYKEILQTKDAERRKLLLKAFNELSLNVIPCESLIAGVSPINSAVGDGQLYMKIRRDLYLIEKKCKAYAIEHDALIGEVAINNDFILITNDENFASIVKSHGGKILFLSLLLVQSVKKD